MSYDVLPAALIVEYPIYHSRAVQSKGTHGAGGRAAFGSDLHRHPPAGVPADHQRFSAPVIVDSAQELICSQHNFSACLAESGGKVFHDLCHLVRTQLDVLITSSQSHEQVLIFRLYEFLQQLSLICVESVLIRHLQVILYRDGDMQDDGVARIFAA